jgi:hypothetical protein
MLPQVCFDDLIAGRRSIAQQQPGGSIVVPGTFLVEPLHTQAVT